MIQASKREIVCGEVDGNEPSRDEVTEVVKLVGVCDSIDGRIDSEEEEEEVRDMPQTVTREY